MPGEPKRARRPAVRCPRAGGCRRPGHRALHRDPVVRCGLRPAPAGRRRAARRHRRRRRRRPCSASISARITSRTRCPRSLHVHDRRRLPRPKHRSRRRTPIKVSQTSKNRPVTISETGEGMTDPGRRCGSRVSRSWFRSRSERSTRPPSSGNAGSKLNTPRITFSQASRTSQAPATKSTAATAPEPVASTAPRRRRRARCW